ncbi:MAG: hypothetical protein LBD31_10975 [Treponema sp.]|jgi:hypothetical protein|nr:hypothetical protein [Treponema sp.]
MARKVFPWSLLLFAALRIPLAAAPFWVDKQPADTPDTVYFRALAEAEGREAAERSALNNLHAEAARYILVSIHASDREDSRTVQRGANGVINEQYVAEFKSEIESYTDMLVSGIKTEVHSEQYAGSSGRRLWRAWALGAASRQKLEAEMAAYPARISARYSGLIAESGSLAGDIRSRQSILRALETNPLHKDVAYLDLPGGRVNLYDYLSERISVLGGSVSFAPIPPQKARKGETLRLPVQVSSPLHPSPGQLEYRVTLSRLNGGAAPLAYTAAAIDTLPLPVGAYRGSVELRLADISPLLRNIVREFTLELGLPAPPEKPFSPGAFGGQWEGTVAYGANGQSYRDRYTIAVYADGTCWAAVAAEDGAAQAALGYWSADEGVFRLDCVFDTPAIARLPGLRWVSVYTLENNNRRLKMNVKPAPDYSGVAGLTLNRER